MTARQRLILIIAVIGSVVAVASWVSFYTVSRSKSNLHALPPTAEPASTPTTTPTTVPTATPAARTDFSRFNAKLAFSAELPTGWSASYVASSEAIAVFPTADSTSLDKAVIFIRYFEANQFLTLSTVDVLSRTETTVTDHATVRYEIQKKAGVADFANQPVWRSQKHIVTDIRATSTSPSLFLVVGQNPTLANADYDTFLKSIQFYTDVSSLRSPLDRIDERVTKKRFGTLVSPTNSPVSPEKFSGYHTAWDFETFVDEADKAVTITAFCGGKIVSKKSADGYGGVVVQECQLGTQAVTIIYGHLKLASVTNNIGDYLAPGATIGELGQANSTDTGDERKHLHFGIHKGTAIDIKGYVSTQAALSAWLDPDTYL